MDNIFKNCKDFINNHLYKYYFDNVNINNIIIKFIYKFYITYISKKYYKIFKKYFINSDVINYKFIYSFIYLYTEVNNKIYNDRKNKINDNICINKITKYFKDNIECYTINIIYFNNNINIIVENNIIRIIYTINNTDTYSNTYENIYENNIFKYSKKQLNSEYIFKSICDSILDYLYITLIWSKKYEKINKTY